MAQPIEMFEGCKHGSSIVGKESATRTFPPNIIYLAYFLLMLFVMPRETSACHGSEALQGGIVDRICRAAATGDVDAVSRLCIGQSAGLARERDEQGLLPIHHAAMAGQDGSLRALYAIAPDTLSCTDSEMKRNVAHFAANR